MQSAVEGIQYGTATDALQHDDDMLQPGIQVAPNLDDQPEKRQLQYWAVAITSPPSPSQIVADLDVFLPGDTIGRKVSMRGLPCSALDEGGAAAMPLKGAVATGQISDQQAQSIIDACAAGAAAVFEARGYLGRDQQHGRQDFEVRVTGPAGATATTSGGLHVLPVAGIRIDFGRVDFGLVKAGVPITVPGDLRFNPPNDSFPTVKNVGNTAANVNIWLGRMASAGGGVIDRFGVTFNGEEAGSIAAESHVCFAHALDPGALGGLDVTVYPGAVPAGTYHSSLKIWGTMGCPGSSPTPTATSLPTAVPTPSAAPTITGTSTPTAKPVGTATLSTTPTGTPIHTPTPTAIAQPTATPAPTGTPTPLPAATVEPTATPPPEPAMTPTAAPTGTATAESD